MWKYVAILAMNILAAGPIPSPPPDGSNPIQSYYSAANLISTLTDRALWLFFLFVILTIAWVIDRRKEKELTHYREHIARTLISVDKIMERVEKRLND